MNTDAAKNIISAFFDPTSPTAIDPVKLRAQLSKISRGQLVANGVPEESVDKLTDDQANALNIEMMNRFLGVK